MMIARRRFVSTVTRLVTGGLLLGVARPVRAQGTMPKSVAKDSVPRSTPASSPGVTAREIRIGMSAAFTGTAHPLTDRAFGHAQGRGNVLLLPTLLLQFPGTPSSTFEPIQVCFFCLHTSWSCKFRASR